MASKNNQKKNGFSSLSIYRVVDEEIGKLKNNRIHYTYQNINKRNNENKNQNKLYKSEQVNYLSTQIKSMNNKSTEKNMNNKNSIKIVRYSSMKNEEIAENRNKNKLNNFRISNSSKEKDKSFNKKSVNTYKSKQTKKRNPDRIERIIIDIVNNNNDDNETIKTQSNYENEIILKNSINNKDNNIENLENKNNYINNSKIDNLQASLNMVGYRWANDCEERKEINIPVLSNQIDKKKREIENIINRWKNEKNIVKEINISFAKIKTNVKENIINNYNNINRWNSIIKKEKNQYFTIFKNDYKDKFLYSEKDYIKDLTKNIYISKNNDNIFYILNNDNCIDDFNTIDYKIIKPNNKNQLESDLYNFYKEKKENYIKNKDNNEELKLNPIYILNDKQIKQFFQELNIDNKSSNKNIYINTQLSMARQTAIDYEVIEIFTPKNKNKDNNSNNSFTNRSNEVNTLKNGKTSESVYKKGKRGSEDFGQYTPISMLGEKFFIYAVSRNLKYSIPERQGFLNFINYNKDNKNGNYDYKALKKIIFA